MIEKDGGPAFPFDNQELGNKHRIAQPGMSMRDYFAAAATEDEIQYYYDESDDNPHVAARFRFADAMLAEREKQR